MEVHAHTHPASGGTRKKWTHYLWEFFVLLGGRGVASIRYSNNGFQPVARNQN